MQCCREVQMLEETVFKTIDSFSEYANKQQTSFDSIAKAYNAANEAAAAAASQEPFLITSSIGPSLSTRSDRYTVHTAPCGWGPIVSSDKVHRLLTHIGNHLDSTDWDAVLHLRIGRAFHCSFNCIQGGGHCRLVLAFF